MCRGHSLLGALGVSRREQDLAVAEENYKRAGELRDTYNEILNKMSERQQVGRPESGAALTFSGEAPRDK